MTTRATALAAALALSSGCGRAAAEPGEAPRPRPCPAEMALVSGKVCVDRFEAHLEERAELGAPSRVWPPNKPPEGADVRAKSARNVLPQAYVSQAEAARACAAADKRLCSDDEWLAACRGASATRFPYGQRWRSGACNDRGKEPLGAVLGARVSEATFGPRGGLMDPRLHLVPGAVARTGRFDRCASEDGVHDMVGNVHEWTADPRGTMRGGYYLDAMSLGEGCEYAAGGHDTAYRDYSTGFRCCKGPR